MIGAFVTILVIGAVILAGMWLFESDSDHDEWRRF